MSDWDSANLEEQTRPARLAASNAWKERFAVKLECRACGHLDEPGNVSPSLDRTAPGTRIIVVAVPEVCPSCRNLRVVE